MSSQFDTETTVALPEYEYSMSKDSYYNNLRRLFQYTKEVK